MVDQWRMAIGLTCLVMSMFQLSVVIVCVQAVIFAYMVLQNGQNCLVYVQANLPTKFSDESSKFIQGALFAFCVNAVWYASLIVGELKYRRNE